MGTESRLLNLHEHPLLKLAGMLFAAAFAIAGAWIYLEDFKWKQKQIHEETVKLHTSLMKRFDEERASDAKWLLVDHDDHDKIMRMIDVLSARLGSEGGLIYQIGVRDGKQLCEKGSTDQR